MTVQAKSIPFVYLAPGTVCVGVYCKYIIDFLTFVYPSWAVSLSTLSPTYQPLSALIDDGGIAFSGSILEVFYGPY